MRAASIGSTRPSPSMSPALIPVPSLSVDSPMNFQEPSREEMRFRSMTESITPSSASAACRVPPA